MIIYEPRFRGRKLMWSERSIQTETVEEMEKLFVVAMLTGSCIELETDEEAENLRRLLPWLDPAFQREAKMVLDAYLTTKEIISKLSP